MYLGKERRNRAVALALAGVLLAGVVLGLLATIATTRASDRAAANAPLPTATAPTTLPVQDPAAGGHDHGDALPADAGTGATIGHPGRLVAMVIGVVLLFACGVMIVHEQRRRAEEEAADPWHESRRDDRRDDRDDWQDDWRDDPQDGPFGGPTGWIS